MEGILPLILSIPRLTTTQTSTTIPSLSDHSNTIIFPNHLHHHTLPGYIKRYHTTIHAYLFSILLHSALILPYTILFRNWALLPCISIFKSHSFFSGFNITSDMDRSSSEDNISVGSQEEANADCKMDFSQDEEDLITRLYNLLGQRWALIAGRIPGRTAEEIEKYWNRRYGSD